MSRSALPVVSSFSVISQIPGVCLFGFAGFALSHTRLCLLWLCLHPPQAVPGPGLRALYIHTGPYMHASTYYIMQVQDSTVRDKTIQPNAIHNNTMQSQSAEHPLSPNHKGKISNYKKTGYDADIEYCHRIYSN